MKIVIVDTGEKKLSLVCRCSRRRRRTQSHRPSVAVIDRRRWLNVVAREEAAAGRQGADVTETRAPHDRRVQRLLPVLHVGGDRDDVAVGFEAEFLADTQSRRVLVIEHERHRLRSWHRRRPPSSPRRDTALRSRAVSGQASSSFNENGRG